MVSKNAFNKSMYVVWIYLRLVRGLILTHAFLWRQAGSQGSEIYAALTAQFSTVRQPCEIPKAETFSLTSVAYHKRR